MQGVTSVWCEINRRWALLSHSESLNSTNPESSRPQYSTDGPLRAVGPAKSLRATTLPEPAIKSAILFIVLMHLCIGISFYNTQLLLRQPFRIGLNVDH